MGKSFYASKRVGSDLRPIHCESLKDSWCTKNKKWCMQCQECETRKSELDLRLRAACIRNIPGRVVTYPAL